MAYSTTDKNALRDAILKMWTPVVGSMSFGELVKDNKKKIIADYGQNYQFHTAMMLGTCDFGFPHSEFPFMENLSDDQPPFEIEREVLAGSWSEGLQFDNLSNLQISDQSDTDYMLVLKNVFFSQEDQLAGKLTLKQDTPYVHAYLTDEDDIKLWKDFFADYDNGRGKRLSSKKLKEKLNQNLYSACFGNSYLNYHDVDDGAAINISDKISIVDHALKLASNVFGLSDMELRSWSDYFRLVMTVTGCDIVLAISCEGWPSCAKEWITRTRKWPHDELLHKITRDGFHIVPKKSPEGDFRLSFSFAETTLIKNLTELQHKVLRSFKAIVKYHQNSCSPHIKEIITTYHLKTIAFWHFERLTQDSITEQTVVSHLILLLKELAEALQVRELPMYFMPMVNLFENVDNPEDAFDMGEEVKKLSNDLPRLILGIESIDTCFQRHTSFGKFVATKVTNWLDIIAKKYGESSPVSDDLKEELELVFAGFDTMLEVYGKLIPKSKDQHTVSTAKSAENSSKT